MERIKERKTVKFTHLNEDGAAYMVDVTAKNPTTRQARAVCCVDC